MKMLHTFVLIFAFISLLPNSVFATGTKTITRGTQNVVINWSVQEVSSCTPDTTYPGNINSGDTVYSTWSSAGTTAAGNKTFSQVNGNLNGSFPQSYIFSCSNGTASDSATLVINDCTSPQVWNSTSKSCVASTGVTVTLDPFNPTGINVGQSATISFTSNGANSCSGTTGSYWEGDLGGTSKTNISTGPINTAGTYTQKVTCTGTSGTGSSVTRTLVVCASGTPWNGSSCAAPSATDCASTPKTWLTNCSATLPLTTSGTPKTVSYNGSSYTGSATYTCSNTVWSGPTSATCSPTSSGTTEPDLVAGAITPTSGTVGNPIALKSTITNQGTASTGSGFTNLFQSATSTDSKGNGVNPTDIGTYQRTTSLSSGNSNSFIATLSYTVSSVGTIYIRACADKSSASNGGTISESSNVNNCGEWTPVAISGAAAQPNLTAGAITPTTATSGTATTFQAAISNIGGATTGTSFYNLIQVATAINGGGTITDIASSSMAALGAGSAATTSKSYIFASAGTYSMRACADKSSAANTGTITESDEGNCGPWTTITVSSSVVTGTIAFSPTTCTIAASSSNCAVDTIWSTQNNPTTTVSVTRAYDNNSVVTTGNSGTFNVSFPSGTYDFNLRYAGNTLATASITISCAAGTAWNGSICQATPPVVADIVLNGNHTTSGTIVFTCAYSNKYSVTRAEGSSSPYPISNQNYLDTVSTPVTAAGNYTVTCKRGSQSDSAIVTYDPTPAAASTTVSLIANPRTAKVGQVSSLTWNITNPAQSAPLCKITATAVCTGGSCLSPRDDARTTNAASLTTQLSTGTTDSNDPYGANRAMTTALKTPSTRAAGKKTLLLQYTTDFTLSCGATLQKVRVQVSNDNEG